MAYYTYWDFDKTIGAPGYLGAFPTRPPWYSLDSESVIEIVHLCDRITYHYMDQSLDSFPGWQVYESKVDPHISLSHQVGMLVAQVVTEE